MKQNKLIFLLFIAICTLIACNNIFNKSVFTKCNKQPITVAFYNVENLFDTIDNPLKNDDEFLPNGKKEYNSKRYFKKLKDLDKVIGSLNNNNAPEILGLAEVENESVLKDLIKQASFKNTNYKILHQQSKDFRGIDCALIYNANKVEILNYEFITPTFPNEKEPYTSRDIVYAHLKINNCENAHFFVNHWPSRYGGKAKSEPRRLRVATLLKQKIDEIYNLNNDAKILMMGDFNDEPFDKSCSQIIGACSKITELKENKFFNLFGERANIEEFGTYNYRGNWNVLDQFMVSEDFVNVKKGFVAKTENAKVLKEEWMMYYDKKYKYNKPNKTYGGPNYYGGYSDHLPIYLTLEYTK